MIHTVQINPGYAESATRAELLFHYVHGFETIEEYVDALGDFFEENNYFGYKHCINPGDVLPILLRLTNDDLYDFDEACEQTGWVLLTASEDIEIDGCLMHGIKALDGEDFYFRDQYIRRSS